MQVWHFYFVVFFEQSHGDWIFCRQRLVRGKNVSCYPVAPMSRRNPEQVRADAIATADGVAGRATRAEHRRPFAASGFVYLGHVFITIAGLAVSGREPIADDRRDEMRIVE